jgi:GNAT superfamily N-acetyltransferase
MNIDIRSVGDRGACVPALSDIATLGCGPGGAVEVFDFLSPVADSYPGFFQWYFNVFQAGIADGDRKIICKKNGRDLSAVALLKKTPEERKICTFYVAPKHRGRQIGTSLMIDALKWLDIEKPLITVCAERYDDILPMLRKFRFELTGQEFGMYRHNVKEFIFNGQVYH